MEKHNFKKAIQCAEEALYYTGENAYFLLRLAEACEKEGKFGKAAKQYEKILKEYPDNTIICAKLATAYQYRGFHKKALPYFEKAYNKGERTQWFLFSYLQCTLDNSKYEQLEQILLTSLENSTNQDYRKHISEYATLFHIYTRGSKSKYKHIPDIINYYYRYTKAIQHQHQEYEADLTFLFFNMKNMAEIANLGDNEDMKKVTELLLDTCMDADMLEQEKRASLYHLICQDERFSEMLKTIAQCYLIPFETEDEEDDFQERFAKLDVTLCLIEEWDELQSEFSIIKKEFPEFYHMLDDVWTVMAAGNKKLEQYKERLLKECERMAKNFLTPMYYTRHPEKRPLSKSIEWDSFESGTFQREEKKVGRNDPCPCGSGKKYKRCCGKN